MGKTFKKFFDFVSEYSFLVLIILLAGAAFARAQNSIPVSTNLAVDSEVKQKEFDALKKYGGYLFKLGNCKDCHTEKNGALLSGGYKIESAFGNFFGPNITADKDTGIGLWSDQDFITALRRGVAPSGRNYYPAFPYSSYSKLTDADMLALKAYIFSLPAIRKESISHELKFPFNVREFINVWKLSNFSYGGKYTENEFIKARGPYQLIQSKNWDWNRGAYLVEGLMHCTLCHTPRDKLGNFKWNEWMSGSALFGSKKGAPNITQSKKIGVGSWTASDWETFLTEGVSANGTEVGGKMGKIIEDSTSRMNRADLRASIKYLMSIKAVETTELKKTDAGKKE